MLKKIIISQFILKIYLHRLSQLISRLEIIILSRKVQFIVSFYMEKMY